MNPIRQPRNLSAPLKQPTKRQPREPVVLLTIAFDWLKADAPQVARLLRSTIQRHHCPCHLFVDSYGGVYILPDTHPAAVRWPMERFAWFVGTYAYVHRDNDSMLKPDDAGIAEDLAEHAISLAAKTA